MGDQPVPVAVAVGGGLNMAGLVGQDALGGGLSVQHIEHPAAKLFGERCAGEHGDQMGTAQGEDPNLFFTHAVVYPIGHRIDDQCHVGGKFVCIAVVQVADGLFAGIAKGLGDLDSGPLRCLFRENRHHHSAQQHNIAGRVTVLHREGDLVSVRSSQQEPLPRSALYVEARSSITIFVS